MLTYTLLPMLLGTMLQAGSQPLVVDAAWLADHLTDPATVVLHVGPRESYDEAHVPGAQYIQLAEISAPRESNPLPLELPVIEDLDAVLEAKGISNDSRIVVYWAEEWVTPTTRVVFTLTWAGLGGQVSVLDGGLPAWQDAGHPVTADVADVARGNFTPDVDASVVVDAGWVHERLGDDGVAVVDARARRFYDGDSGNGRIPRPGHIAGAGSFPFDQAVTESMRFKSTGELRSLLAGAGASEDAVVVTYCHIGQQASLIWFTAKLAGYKAKLYDGSYTDWAARDDLPVERPEQER